MILVTTPNGKVGSELVRQLHAAGHAVRIGAHTVAKARAAFPAVETVAFDYNDPGTITAALQGVTALYLASPGNSPIEPVTRVIDLAQAAGVERIVRLSAFGVEHGNSPLRQIEQHLEHSDVSWTLLRPSWFMQNYVTQHIESIRHQNAFYEPAADARTAFIDTRDIAAVALTALTTDGHAGQAYPLTGVRAYDRHEVAAAISAAVGRDIQYVSVSDEQFRDAMTGINFPADYIEILSDLYQMVRAGWTEATVDTVKQVTGRDPISFEQFAQDNREAWQ